MKFFYFCPNLHTSLVAKTRKNWNGFVDVYCKKCALWRKKAWHRAI